MKDLIFDEGCIQESLSQIYKKVVKEGYDKYCLLGIGKGGTQVAKRLEELGKFEEVHCCEHFDEPSPDVYDFVKGKEILICEDIVNSGKTVKNTIKLLRENSDVNDIKLLSLVMRQDSSIVPNFYAFETDKGNRAYFPWNKYPVRSYPKGIVRKVSPEDFGKTFACGHEDIDKYSISDFYNHQLNKNIKVYLVEEKGEICSIVQFNEKDAGPFGGLFLDIIATALKFQKKKYAKTLLDLVNNYSFYHEYDFLLGYAFDEVIEMYKALGFEVLHTIENPEYGRLHKIVIIYNTGHEEAIKAELMKD